MKKFIKKFSTLIVVGLVIACMTPILVFAANSSETKLIYNYEQLEAISEDPSGSYKLMCDIDCSNKDWTPIVFNGTFDGNNHALLNLNLEKCSDETRKVYDGNMIAYDAVFSGVFSILENATVKNLNVLGLNINVKTEKDCFVGSIAGFMENSTVENCKIYSDITLFAADKCFGTGGIAGFGNGVAKNNVVETTLVCIDENALDKDEQFLGGAYGAGYIDLIENKVQLDGYISDHGYVHSGGLVGMYILYPAGTSYAGFINKNTVIGAIHFFEDNTDRRAYCAECVGEVMNWTYEFNGNVTDFKRDEKFDYSTDLYPHFDCTSNDIEESSVPANCTDYGYTLETCKTCGYTHKTDFVPRKHVINEWTTVTEATQRQEGLNKGVCSLCNEEVYEVVDMLPATGDDLDVDNFDKTSNITKKLPIIIVILVVIAAIITILAIRTHNIKKRKRRRRRR